MVIGPIYKAQKSINKLIRYVDNLILFWQARKQIAATSKRESSRRSSSVASLPAN
jgi:hypothetical protein